jgi:site-specific recombinase XerD
MQHLDAFLTAKRAAGLSANTLGMYTRVLGHFNDHCLDHDLDALGPAAVEHYLAACRRRVKPSTVAAYYRVIHLYFGWLTRRRYIDANPTADLSKPHVPRQKRNHVTLDEFRRLYAVIPAGDTATWLDHRDRALLVVLFYSGLRVSEALGLHTGDVDLAHRLLTVRRGKGGHDRLVPCPPTLAEPLMSYLYTRPPWHETTLWCGSDGSPRVPGGHIRGALGDEGVRRMLRRRCAAAGMRYANPHQFRHGFAMTLLNAGMDLSAVSAAMGHSSLAITQQVYASWRTDGLSREYDEALRRLQGGG